MKRQWKVLIAVLIMVSFMTITANAATRAVPAGRTITPQQAVPAPQAAPVTPVAAPAMQKVVPGVIAKPVVSASQPSRIILVPGAPGQNVTLAGSGLNQLTAGQVLSGNQVVQSVNVAFSGPVSAATRKIILSASGNSTPGSYTLVMLAGTNRISVPLGITVNSSPGKPEPPPPESAGFVSPGAMRGFNPQPEPPAVEGAHSGQVMPGADVGFNPQPEPPGDLGVQGGLGSPGQNVMMEEEEEPIQAMPGQNQGMNPGQPSGPGNPAPAQGGMQQGQ